MLFAGHPKENIRIRQIDLINKFTLMNEILAARNGNVSDESHS